MSLFVLTAQARLDLLKIWNYVVEDSIDAADKLRDEFHAAFIRLADMPGMGDMDAKLVKVGKPAPLFSIPGPKGGTVDLAQTLRGKKAILVNFWFYG